MTSQRNRICDENLGGLALAGLAIIPVLFYLALSLAHISQYEWNITALLTIQSTTEFFQQFADALPAGLVASPEAGYDGQYYYFAALNPAWAWDPRVGAPLHYMQRIGYPIIARVLALGQPALLPWTLVGWNLFAIAASTFVLARLLQRRGVPPAWSLLATLSVGMVPAIRHSLTEPTAVLFMLLGIAALRAGEQGSAGARERGSRGAGEQGSGGAGAPMHPGTPAPRHPSTPAPRHLWAVLAWSLAVLARETSALLVVPVAFWYIVQRRVVAGLGLLFSIVPYLLWQAFLYSQLGTAVALNSGSGLFRSWPFADMITVWQRGVQALQAGQFDAATKMLSSLLLVPVLLGIIYTARQSWRAGRFNGIHLALLAYLWLALVDGTSPWGHITGIGRHVVFIFPLSLLAPRGVTPEHTAGTWLARYYTLLALVGALWWLTSILLRQHPYFVL